jgi:hypothetical protein
VIASLYQAIFEIYKSGVLPPRRALEREIVSLGVSEIQKERARQEFERSAEQAGFFEHGENRLVWVAAGSPRNNGDQKPRGNSGSDAPLIAALIQKLSAPGTNWSVDERMAWMQLMITGFQVA